MVILESVICKIDYNLILGKGLVLAYCPVPVKWTGFFGWGSTFMQVRCRSLGSLCINHKRITQITRAIADTLVKKPFAASLLVLQ